MAGVVWLWPVWWSALVAEVLAGASASLDLEESLATAPVGRGRVAVETYVSAEGFAPGQRFRLAVVLDLPPDHHIGSHVPPPPDTSDYMETGLELDAPAGLRIDRLVFPPDRARTLMAGDTPIPLRILEGRVVIGVEGLVLAEASPGPRTITGRLRYQLCDDRTNTCFPPREHELAFPLRVLPAGATAPASHPEVFAAVDWQAPATAPATGPTEVPPPAGLSPSRQAELEAKIAQGLAIFLLYAAGAGLLSLLTPCVFPMIPITVSFFTKQAEREGNRPWATAAVYCLSIVIVFSLVGVLLAAFATAGDAVKLAQNPWVNLITGAIFVAFALMLFGVFELRVPTVLVNLTSRRGRPGSLVGIVFMALTFTLVSFTCTTPFVGSVLVFGARGGRWLYPILGMVVYAAAFAAPFFFLAAFPGLVARMPRSGPWLHHVKVVMGLLELALAAKFLSNTDLVWNVGVLTHDVVLALWALTAVAIGVYLLDLRGLAGGAKGPRAGPLRWGLAAAWLAVGGYLGAGLFGARLTWLVEAYLPPARIEWIQDYAAALDLARRSGKPMFLDFTGVTCTNCRVMEETVFKEPRVAARLQEFVLVRLYTDRGDQAAANAAMQESRFGTVELPLYVVQTPDERPVAKTGYTVTVQAFLDFLSQSLRQAGVRSDAPSG